MPERDPQRPPTAAVRAAAGATYTAFAGCGFAFASWVSRIPQVRERLHLDPAELGLLLLALSAGALLAPPLAGPLVARTGARGTVIAMAFLVAAALTTVGVGHLAGVLPVVVGLFLLGFGQAAWAVAMNVHGALVERALGRSVMSRFHAGFSVGTVAGALLGAGAVALGVPVAVHLLVVAALIAVVVPTRARGFLGRAPEPSAAAMPSAPAPRTGATDDAAGSSDRGSAPGPGAAPAGRRALTAWTERRTLLIGVCAFAFAFVEGTGNDWISVAMIDGYDVSAAAGTLAYAVFLTAMTLTRWYGPALLDRYGRVQVVRLLALVALAGLALFIHAPSAPLAYAGVLLWGVGVSLGQPVSLSAAADDPRHAAGRVSAVASIASCAFLAGPPLIGFLGHQVGVLQALTVVMALLVLAVFASATLAPPGTGPKAHGARPAPA